MWIKMERKHWIVIGIGIFLIIASLFYMYIKKVQPIYAEQNQLMIEMEQLEDQTAAKEKDNIISAGEQEAQYFSLEQKFPRTPFRDEFLLTIDRAEEMSESHVLAAVFLENGPEELIQEATEEETEEATSLTFREEEETGEEKKDEDQKGNLPENIEDITYHVTVESPSYEQVERFVSILDESERFIDIHSLTFAGQEEWVWRDEEPDPLTFEIIVSAYFYPTEKE